MARTRATMLTALSATAVLACGGCDGTGREPAGADGSASVSATPTLAPTPTPSKPPTSVPSSSTPVVHVYAGGELPGLSIADEAEATRLVDPPAGFAAYALARRRASPASELTVVATRTDGWASGFTSDVVDGHLAGGNLAVWRDSGSGWAEALATQDEFLCSDLHRLGVPAYPVGPQRCSEDQKDLDYVP